MTSQESFKKRIRARMERTGERYNAARRNLIDQAQQAGTARIWISEPEVPDASVLAATGRDWNAWCDLIDEAHIDPRDHPALVAFARDHMGPEAGDKIGWWSQGVAVGYERITGVRARNQMADGTYTATRSRTLTVDVDRLRALLLDDDARTDLFPDHETSLRSRPSSKALRVAIGDGVALFSMDALPDGRIRLTVTHEKLPTPEDVTLWKHYWGEWLEAVAEA